MSKTTPPKLSAIHSLLAFSCPRCSYSVHVQLPRLQTSTLWISHVTFHWNSSSDYINNSQPSLYHPLCYAAFPITCLRPLSSSTRKPHCIVKVFEVCERSSWSFHPHFSRSRPCRPLVSCGLPEARPVVCSFLGPHGWQHLTGDMGASKRPRTKREWNEHIKDFVFPSIHLTLCASLWSGFPSGYSCLAQGLASDK